MATNSGHSKPRCGQCGDQESHDSYPCTLRQTEWSPQTLRKYHQILNGSPNTGYGELSLFDPKKNVVVSLGIAENAHAQKDLEGLYTLESFRRVLGNSAEDRTSRYLYIHAANSRSALCCSKEQLQHVMSHYQVTPAFLEHVFTFCDRSSPHMQATMRVDDRLRRTTTDSISAMPYDNRIQHTFNLVGLEFDPKKEQGRSPDTAPYLSYFYRQTAAYHSFTPSSGKSIWIIMKANMVIRNSMTELVQSLGEENHPNSPEKSFRVAMRSHQIIYEWAVENWKPYLDHLEKEVSELEDIAQFIPINNYARDAFIAQQITKKTTMNSHFSSTKGNKQDWRNWVPFKTAPTSKDEPPTAARGQVAGEVREIALQDFNQPPKPIKPHESTASLGMEGPSIPKIFRFDRLQSLYTHVKSLRDADLVLGQNQSVIRDMIERYKQLVEVKEFREHINIDRHELQGYLDRAERCARELEGHRAHVNSLQATLDKTIELFNGVLQFYNMRVGELYAQLAKSSTDAMELLTLKTKHETVSIHVITILTLIFLPSTFIATFFGSGIIDFEREKHSDDLGYWATRWGALKLFVLFCLPLTFVVVSAWAITYNRSRKRYRNEKARLQSGQFSQNSDKV